MTTLARLIAVNDDDGTAPITDVTNTIVGLVLTDHRDLAAELLYPAVRDEVRRRRRQHDRRAENGAFNPDDGTGETFTDTDAGLVSMTSDPISAYRAILRHTFYCPAIGRRVEWGQATIAQHQDRADMQRSSARSLLEDVERHERAIDFITETGTTCLDEAVAARVAVA